MDKISYRSNTLPRRAIKRSVAPGFFGNTFVKIGFLSISALLLYNVAHSVDITVKKVNILKNARQEVESLRVTNLELDTQLQSMQTPEYIEVEARDRLNFSGKNDITFVIPDALMRSAGERLDAILNTNQEVNPKSGLDQWKELVVCGV